MTCTSLTGLSTDQVNKPRLGTFKNKLSCDNSQCLLRRFCNFTTTIYSMVNLHLLPYTKDYIDENTKFYS